MFLGIRICHGKPIWKVLSFFFFFSFSLECCVNYYIWCLSSDISVFPNPTCDKWKDYRGLQSQTKANCILFDIKILRSGSWTKNSSEFFLSLSMAQIYHYTILKIIRHKPENNNYYFVSLSPLFAAMSDLPNVQLSHWTLSETPLCFRVVTVNPVCEVSLLRAATFST